MISTAAHVKEQQKKHWDAVASGWADRVDWTDRNFRPLTEWLRQAAGWTTSARVLDVACGVGYPALAAAECVQPAGSVVATDITPAMLAAASRRAAAAGLHNIEFLETDAEELRFGDNEFDAVTNAYGLMFCPDPQRAIREMHRVLKPGGYFALAVWDEASKSPFFTVVNAVAAQFLSLPPPDATAPGPFRLAPTGILESLLTTGGFSEFQIVNLEMTFECESAAEYFQIFSDLAWKSRIASLTEAETARFKASVVEAARPLLDGDRLRLVATSRCASGRKKPLAPGA